MTKVSLPAMRFFVIVALVVVSSCKNMPSSGYTIANASSWISSADISHSTKAAESGDPQAAFRLGRYYANLTTEREKALRYYRISAESGDVQAMYNLGFLLTASEQPSEKLEGITWLKAAKAKGKKEADELLRMIEGQTTEQAGQP